MTRSDHLLRMLLCGALLALAACDRPTQPAADAARRAELARLDAEFASRTQVARMAREEALTAPDGWTSLVGLHRIELRSHFIGSAPGSGIRLAHGPGRLGLLQSADGFAFTPERGTAVTLDGEPVTTRVALRSDRDGPPSVLGFDEGRGALSIIERGGAAFVRVRHADAESRRRFGGLDYWPIDRGWRLEGRFTPAPASARIDVANILGMVEPTRTPGTVTFEYEGVSHTLHALEGADGGLFLILADRTSGHGSYSAGRYLDTPPPDAQGRVVLDFNRAYNPPCAFTSFATCPLPPAGNRLDLAIEAGEQAYRTPR
ncbi:DUF1684 domain-containing protein [Luteimonas deserti]|uniref:DUF1684 domain-containing protein n=1 Tax=Luteimonas deserti TaxID=2752306 RepID=A0A7Z0TZC6_9GAMM|nr:DUF1684 domain-containing protein [Luteimonas deserti]NYZ63815.1 DUF1684 domain-containing protein [Luteimonas deserti]